ncbi:hypothetical protein HanRHA438_Chr11g0482491 [Helianthus annuus]|nr:hypothetical protein HanRHA438_Chr11g0482491 [Helianthus annuus]
MGSAPNSPNLADAIPPNPSLLGSLLFLVAPLLSSLTPKLPTAATVFPPSVTKFFLFLWPSFHHSGNPTSLKH